MYTRAGAFKTDADGYVINSQNQRLQVFPPAANGGFNTGAMNDLRLLAGESAPNATTNMELILNLPADGAIPTTMPFDATNTDSYNRATSVTVYDSLGAAHTGTVYFQKAAPNQWNTYLYIDGNPIGTTTAAQPGVGTGSVDTTTLNYPANYNLTVNGNVIATGSANGAALVASTQSAVDAAVIAGGGAAGDAVVSLNAQNRLVITNNGNVQLNMGGTDAGAVFGSLASVSPLMAAGSAQPNVLNFNNVGGLVQPVNGNISFPGYTTGHRCGADEPDARLRRRHAVRQQLRRYLHPPRTASPPAS